MSDTDSFIDEVSEEVRKERLFVLIKRYGWIAALAVVAIVGGAAWVEWTKAQDAAAAQAVGTQIVSALEESDEEAQLAKLSVIDADPAPGVIVDLLVAARAEASGEVSEAREALSRVRNSAEASQFYKDLATLKLAMLDGLGSASEARVSLEALTIAGSPFRLLASEQLALMDVAQGARDAALERLNGILVDNEVTAGLQRRVSQLIVALGETPGGA